MFQYGKALVYLPANEHKDLAIKIVKEVAEAYVSGTIRREELKAEKDRKRKAHVPSTRTSQKENNEDAEAKGDEEKDDKGDQGCAETTASSGASGSHARGSKAVVAKKPAATTHGHIVNALSNIGAPPGPSEMDLAFDF